MSNLEIKELHERTMDSGISTEDKAYVSVVAENGENSLPSFCCTAMCIP